jgi:adenosylmethionine-8-amino-7-oxononanoate aminotransferase
MIVAAEMSRDGDRHQPFPWQERRGLRVYRHGLAHEALLRPIGNVVYFMPPYVITLDEIDRLVETARAGIEAATCD